MPRGVFGEAEGPPPKFKTMIGCHVNNVSTPLPKKSQILDQSPPQIKTCSIYATACTYTYLKISKTRPCFNVF